jgi:hypothetical protein
MNRPAYAARDILSLCAQSIRDEDLADRLELIEGQIEEAEAAYIESARKEALFSIPQSAGVGNVTVDEMKRVYKGTFAKSKATRTSMT